MRSGSKAEIHTANLLLPEKDEILKTEEWEDATPEDLEQAFVVQSQAEDKDEDLEETEKLDLHQLQVARAEAREKANMGQEVSKRNFEHVQTFSDEELKNAREEHYRNEPMRQADNPVQFLDMAAIQETYRQSLLEEQRKKQEAQKVQKEGGVRGFFGRLFGRK